MANICTKRESNGLTSETDIYMYGCQLNLWLRAYRVLVAAVVAAVTAKFVNDDASSTENPQSIDVEKSARDVLRNLDAQLANWYNKQSIAGWSYASNLTEENLAEKLNVTVAMTNALNQISQEANNFPWTSIDDENVKRQFKKLGTLGTTMLSEEVREWFSLVNLDNKDVS